MHWLRRGVVQTRLSMKTFCWTLLLWFAESTAVASGRDRSVSNIVTSHCTERTVRINAYLEASRHGLWLTDAIGATKGLALSFEDASEHPSMDTLRNYVFRPQNYMGRIFHARFHGTLQCASDSSRPVGIKVKEVDAVREHLIKDAKSISPNRLLEKSEQMVARLRLPP